LRSCYVWSQEAADSIGETFDFAARMWAASASMKAFDLWSWDEVLIGQREVISLGLPRSRGSGNTASYPEQATQLHADGSCGFGIEGI
jgi:hypothetical protein